ncbi:hypothetical protein FOCG_18148 [Fusarium oxysporum f. sp. radicis-lycopersici 26381]|nr:hypothetical protein FOCG_18148 [Fusarium oxysporum f. sp. radicis-lycopersici 26381]
MSSENPPNHQGTVIRVEERTVITWTRNDKEVQTTITMAIFNTRALPQKPTMMRLSTNQILALNKMMS